MKPEQIFNPRRFLLLIRNDLFLNRNLFFIYAAATIGVMLFIYVQDAGKDLSSFSDERLCFFGLYLIGLLFTCRLFSDLKDEPKNIAWQTLPASLMEKYTSRIVLSTILFTAGWLGFFYVVSHGSSMATSQLLGESHRVLGLFDQTILIESYRYWVVQSLLLFGIVYFKKNAPVKTVLGLIVYLILLVFVCGIIVELVFGDYSNGLGWNINISQKAFSIGTNLHGDLMSFLNTSAATPFLLFTLRTSKIIFCYLIMPFFWILGYLRLKEMEV